MDTNFLHEFGLIHHNVSMKSLCSFRVGGFVDTVFYPSSVESLQKAVRLIKNHILPYKIWGNGTNLLPSDDPYAGIVIKLSRLNEIRFEHDHCIAQAGASLIACAYFAAYRNLSGLEFAYGIPASVGGATVMNAGAYQHDVFEVIDAVHVLKDDQLQWLAPETFSASYRESAFQHTDWIVLGVRFKLTQSDRSAIFALMEDRKHRRKQSQALDYPSAGSVFKNPPQLQAWALVDQVGLRGFRHGGACVSQKHSNFIVNDQNASAQDIKELIELVQERVRNQLNLELITEIEFFNFS